MKLGIAVVAGGGVDERLQKAARRLAGAGSGEVHAEGGEDLAEVALEALEVGGSDRSRIVLAWGQLDDGIHRASSSRWGTMRIRASRRNASRATSASSATASNA